MKEHTRVARARRGIERRLFLKAIGLGMSAPIAWQLSRSAVAQAQATRPKRLMIYFMPHGVPPEHYNPVWNTSTPTDFSLINSGVSILGALEPFKQYVSVLQGFAYPGASTHQGILTVLSNFGDGRVVDDTTPRTTFEHVIANGQNHPAFVFDAATGKFVSCMTNTLLPGFGPAWYGLETAHRGPDSLTPGKGDGCYAADASPLGEDDDVNPAID